MKIKNRLPRKTKKIIKDFSIYYVDALPKNIQISPIKQDFCQNQNWIFNI